MKKLFYAVVALSLFATSCAKDEAAAPEATAKTKTVTFSVKAPEMQTRAAGDGTQATTLYYAFYDETGKVLTGLPNSTTGVTWTPLTGEELEVTLVEGKTYSAIFVAVNAGAPYEVDMTDKTMTIDYSTIKCNSEANDAFYAYLGNITTGNPKNDEDILLKRPFAQLNIGAPTTDITSAENAGLTINSVKVGATVANVLNLVDGSVSGEAAIEFGWATKGAESFTHESITYTILATTYVLVDGEKSLSTVGFSMSEAADGSAPVARSFTAVPIQRNHRTFVLGNIVTNADAALTYVIKVAPGFETGDIVNEQ